jgi:hypothetical protein
VTKILLHDAGHGHAQSCGEILRCHRALFLRVLQQLDETVRQPLGISGRIELNGQLFALGHLAKISQIGANDWYAKRACQVGNPAAPSGRRIGHDRRGAALE